MPEKRRDVARAPRVRKGQLDVTLTREEFGRRMMERFYDPAFEGIPSDVERVVEAAWDAYIKYRKSPRTRRAGSGFADPDFQLPVEWLETRRRILEAGRRQKNRRARSRILLVCGSSRNDQTCPGEMSKTFRLLEMARETIEAERRCEVEVLDLSRLTAEYGKVIHPCKACVATAMPLCNWPCSCFPNHALGQVQDWMSDIYPMWAAAHGVMILSPVNWYQAPSVLKLMMDRLVCADGGNPDPTSTGGKDPAKAKALELKGWPYPRHLAGRAYAVVVHGDAAGVDTLRRILSDWLSDMGLISAGPAAMVGRYLGYYRPYATSHEDLDRDSALQEEVRNAARALVERVRQIRSGTYRDAEEGLPDPRPK
jgi:multimeric flavodoxin WrbA